MEEKPSGFFLHFKSKIEKIRKAEFPIFALLGTATTGSSFQKGAGHRHKKLDPFGVIFLVPVERRCWKSQWDIIFPVTP